MKTRYTVVLSVVAGAALGAAAVQGLHAQAKPKAYTVSEAETLDAATLPAFISALEVAQSAAGGHNLHTRGGRVVSLDGPAAPERVSIIEWDSLEQAQAFYKSKAWDDLAPQRDKAIKIIRRYAVEVVNTPAFAPPAPTDSGWCPPNSCAKDGGRWASHVGNCSPKNCRASH